MSGQITNLEVTVTWKKDTENAANDQVLLEMFKERVANLFITTTESFNSRELKPNRQEVVHKGRKPGPNYSKRPLSAFMLFLKENRQAIKKTLAPGVHLMTINQVSGQLWRELSDLEREKYEIKAKELMESWKKEARKSLPIKDNNPKMPLSAFMLFLKENRQAIKDSLEPGASLMIFNQESSRIWRQLPTAEKDKYKIQAREKMDAWKIEMKRSFDGPNLPKKLRCELPRTEKGKNETPAREKMLSLKIDAKSKNPSRKLDFA